MDQLTQVTIPTTETVAKDLPDPAREDIPVPSDPNTLLLAGIFIFATLAAAYFAAEVILPIVLAFVMMLLLSPGHFPPGPDARARAAQDRRRIHPGDEPRRPRSFSARLSDSCAEPPQAA
jgi:hypothetical protein